MKKIEITYYSTLTKQIFGVKQTEANTVFVSHPAKLNIQYVSILLSNMTYSSSPTFQLYSWIYGDKLFPKCSPSTTCEKPQRHT